MQPDSHYFGDRLRTSMLEGLFGSRSHPPRLQLAASPSRAGWLSLSGLGLTLPTAHRH